MTAWLENLSIWIQSLPPLGAAAMIFVLSMVPVAELRAAIPIGVLAGLPWYWNLLASVMGNLVPVPFIILFIRHIFLWLKDRSKLAGFIYRLEQRALSKASYVYRFQLVGLMILVAIPLPGTGAWTGALLAALLNLRLKNAFPAIALGVLIAGIIVSLLSYGVVHIFA